MLTQPSEGTHAGHDPANVVRAREAAAAGDALCARGEFARAAECYRQAVWLCPAAAGYHLRLADVALHLGDHALAERHLLQATRLDPRCGAAHDGLAQLCLRAGRLDDALRHSAAALQAHAGAHDFVATRANVLAAAGQAKEAWDLAAPLASEGPADAHESAGARLAAACASVSRHVGRETEAVGVVERALERRGLSRDDQGLLHFAAVGLLDRLGRYDEAFAHAKTGNEVARGGAPGGYDPAGHARWVSDRIDYATAERLRSFPRATHGNRRPVLIVGMPRSGTSLVEQVLACHPQVFAGGELPALGRIAHALTLAGRDEGHPFPEYLESVCAREADRLAAEYLAALPAGGAPYVTDKMPLNCMVLSLAEVLLPGCHVIHCVRNPLDTCLNCYLTDFAAGHEFSRDLRHLGAFYRDYRRLVRHCKRVLTLPILDVRYEDLVLDAEAQARRMLDFLGLPWDDRCMRPHESPRPVHTASREQVRRPIYVSSMGRGRHYERHLGELIAALTGPGPCTPDRSRPAPSTVLA